MYLTLGMICAFFPQGLLGPFIGVIVDKFSRKRIMILSDLFISLASLSLLIISFFSGIPLYLIYIVLTLRSIGTAFHNPAFQALIATIVPKEMLTTCAGYSQGFKSLSTLLSPALGATFYGLWGLNVVILFDVFAGLFSIIILRILTIPNDNPTHHKALHANGNTTISTNTNVNMNMNMNTNTNVNVNMNMNTNTNANMNVNTNTNANTNTNVDAAHIKLKRVSFMNETINGLHIIKETHGILSLFMIGIIYSFFYVPVGSLFPFIVIDHFHGTITHSSIVEILYSIGTLSGSFALAKTAKKLNKPFALSFSIFLYGTNIVILALLPLNGGLSTFMVLALIMGTSTPFFFGIQTAFFQAYLPNEYLGRVFSINSSFKSLIMPITLSISGFAIENIGLSKWFLLLGILTVFLSFGTYFFSRITSPRCPPPL